MGARLFDAITRVLLVQEDVIRRFKNQEMEKIKMMNLDLEGIHIFSGAFTKIRAEINDGLIFDY